MSYDSKCQKEAMLCRLIFRKGEDAKMILNFTQNCVSTIKISQGAKIVYPTWAPGANIIFSLEGNKI